MVVPVAKMTSPKGSLELNHRSTQKNIQKFSSEHICSDS